MKKESTSSGKTFMPFMIAHTHKITHKTLCTIKKNMQSTGQDICIYSK